MGILVRKGEKADLPYILEIVNYEIEHSAAIYDYRARTLEEQWEWYEYKVNNQFPLLVAVEGNTVTGFGTYGPFREKVGYRRTVEHSIYIHRKYRGLGVGSILMKELIARARTEKYHTMIAGIDSSNKASIDFHRKFGFYEVGKFREVGYKFGRWLDVVFMQLMLEENENSPGE